VAVFLGCLVAAGFGSADFVGGRASMDASTWAVLLVAQLCAVAGALVLAFTVGAHTAPHDFLFGAASGAVTILGLALLYRGLATGSMGIVAPVTAVVGSLIPISWGLAHGERPSGVVLAGVVVAVSAGALVAREPGPVASRAARGVGLAVGAGLLLGSSLVLFAQTSSTAGMWPVLASRAAALSIVVVALTWLSFTSDVRFPSTHGRVLAVGAGLFDLAATALVLLAVHKGLLVVVAALAALAPGVTALLAWRVLDERLSTVQQLGLVLALTGLVLVSLG
jgi:drug/metabolite transporter (DMT)-like permease